MKNIKDELQHIILRDGQAGQTSQLKKTQSFLRRHAETSVFFKEQQQFKSEEAAAILIYAAEVGFWYDKPIGERLPCPHTGKAISNYLFPTRLFAFAFFQITFLVEFSY